MPAGYLLRTWTILPLERAEIFDFFGDAFNLERITPAFLNFRVLTPPPIPMGRGTLIDYRISLHGLPMRWKTEITAWEPPVRFVDTQLRGPYKQWVHTHTFEDVPGGTMIRDQVHYQLYGPAVVGAVLNQWMVEPDVTRIFQYRQRAMQEAFGLTSGVQHGPVEVTPA